jgi:hypothetical protein
VVTGTVYVDLTTAGELARNRVYFALNATPDGAKVILHVGGIVPALAYDAYGFTLQHVDRLHIDVQGEAEAVKQWYNALTTGRLHLGVAV